MFDLDTWEATPPVRGRRPPRRRSRIALLLVIAVLIASAIGSVWFLLISPNGDDLGTAEEALPVRKNYCTSSSDGYWAELSPEQAGNAAIIAAAADRRGLPRQASTIALATAFQESMLRNIRHGDRDSLGLFQQRPSQGWGTARQITDPVYSTNAFYDALVKVPGYRSMPVTEAAQTVQRSAFPDAYADHEDAAEAIAVGLDGRAPAAFACVLPSASLPPQRAGRQGLTRRAVALRAAATRETGVRTTRVIAPTVIRFRVAASKGDRRAWGLAGWAVARAERLGIVEIRVGGRVWNRDRSADGWTAFTGTRPREVVIAVA